MRDSPRDLELRPYEDANADDLLLIYRNAIHISAEPYYSIEQRQAWAPVAIDREAWRKRMQALRPTVVWVSGRPVAYADLQPDGYIDHFFVHPQAGGHGVGGVLLDELIRQAKVLGKKKIYADVSLAAEGFFLKRGFSLIWRTSNPIRGVDVPNARMLMELHPAADAA